MGEAELIKERLRKLKEIKDFGINPYAYNYDVKNSAVELQAKYTNLSAEEQTEDKVSVAGRIMALRNMGKAAFGNIKDGSGKIQFYIRKDEVGEEYKIFKRADIGDIIGVHGTIFKTKTGELTIKVKQFTMLTKSMRPLPEKFHGLKDPELRYRQRYVDLIMNPEVKDVFIKRAQIYKAIREYLDTKGFIEVRTPILQTQYGGGMAKPFITMINAWNMPMYLRIAYELHLKRLLVGGMEKVYDLSSCFRNEGVDKTHNPEFAMMEIQWAYADYHDAMRLTEELWEYAAIKVNGKTTVEYQGKEIDFKAPWKRMTMKQALKELGGVDVDELSDEDLKNLVRKHGVECEKTKGHMIAGLFEELCEEKLVQPTHITDHPAETSPLAKRHRKNPEVVERVEPFCNGWEIGNCYSELIDPVLQKKLLEEQAEKGRAGNEEAHPMDEDYIRALEYGLPPNCGIGIGIDRMIMLLTQSESIKDVILFPIMKPQGEKIIETKKETTTETKKEPKTGTIEKVVIKNAGINLEETHKLIKKYVKDQALKRHILASGAAVKAIAKKLGKNEEAWEIAGLLHDLDFEMIKNRLEEHGKRTIKLLEEYDIDKNILQAIQAHNPEATGIHPKTDLDYGLTCGETITGLIIATTMIYPDKKIASVKEKSIQKRMKEGAFAKNVDRNLIRLCEKIGIPLEEFIELSLKAMQEISTELGL